MGGRVAQLSLFAVALVIGTLLVGQLRSQARPIELSNLSAQELSALIETLSSRNVELSDALADLRDSDHTELRLSCVGTLAIRWLIPRLPAFHARHPTVRVKVTESYAPVDFARDRIDFWLANCTNAVCR